MPKRLPPTPPTLIVNAPSRRGRLRRSDCSEPGLRRLRRGRGFTYLDEDGNRITEPEVLERLRALVIPPAWKDVWICPDPLGHLQATGLDGAGRKQYLYHERWRAHRDRMKFDKMVRFGVALPKLRQQVARDLGQQDPTRERVLACALRLLDLGVFRIGSEEYADEESGIGLATIRKDHVSVCSDAEIEFDYPAKGGIRRRITIKDPVSARLISTLRRRRSGGDDLLAYRANGRWHNVRSHEINDYLKEKLGEDFSAKDFRTWNATVMAAVSVAAEGRDAQTQRARKRVIDGAVKGVAAVLGNTPAVARRAYIDPRVFDRYQSGWTIAGVLDDVIGLDPTDDRRRATIESAVVDLLNERTESPAIEHLAA